MLDFYDYFDKYFIKFYQWINMSDADAIRYANISELVVALILSILLFYLVRFILRSVVVTLINKTKNEWDDLLLHHKILHKASYLAPAIFIDLSIDHILVNHVVWLEIGHLLIDIYLTIIVANVIVALIEVFAHIAKVTSKNKGLPVKGVSQILKIIVYIVMTIVVISFLFGKSPFAILTGLGAASAISLLIFRDAILGFVGGIQLAAYDMVKEGDWLSLPKHDADGVVIDISLTTVKVQNWDKTISTIPTYSLVSEAVKNWRGMEESEGRRIKRSVNIDMTSIKFCTPEMLKRYQKYSLLQDYLNTKEEELEVYNATNKVDDKILVNGRRQTNIGVFRAYLVEYLRSLPEVHNGMTFIVRQLQPTEKGIPMEVYVFSKIQSWVEYEAIQSDIFDHVLAVVPEFDLKVFQEPTGADFRFLNK